MQSSNRSIGQSSFVLRLSYFVFRISYFVFGLALSRLLFEFFFPSLSWLGRPLGAIAVGVVTLVVGELLHRHTKLNYHPGHTILLVNLVWLLNPAVDVPRAMIFLLGSLWVAMVLAPAGPFFRGKTSLPLPVALWVSAPIALLYLATLGRTVGRADTFEFQVVAPQLGIVHPTGYPLYLLLGKLWTLLPFGSTALRLNLGTAVYGIAAVAITAVIIYRLAPLFISDGLSRAAAALFGAGLLAIAPTFWSQAVEAEVYTLHTLIVGTIVLLLIGVLGSESPPPHWLAWAGLLGGLGVTHHLTTVFMAPPILLTWLFTRQKIGWSWRTVWSEGWPAVVAFLAPLALYLYLPLRWQAVNGEPMGTQRFIEWVVGGRFRGALQWGAWLNDATRYRVVGQLFIDEWPLWLLGLAAIGLFMLLWRRWRLGVVLLAVWLGYTFYSLNYYVPDLNVFLLPAHLVIAVWAAVGAAAVGALILKWLPASFQGTAPTALAALWLLPLLWLTAGRFTNANAAVYDGRAEWGRGVLRSDIKLGAAILADSAKHPPLYYMQQAEGLRPDLDIVILPDEAAYRQQLDARLAAGQPVYLARFLPNLAGSYHLQTLGPLVEVLNTPRFGVPVIVEQKRDQIGPLTLRGVNVLRHAHVDSGSAALTLYWAADQPPASPQWVYVRWADGLPLNPAGVHPVHNSYPLNAWRPGEVVVDTYYLPLPAHPPPKLAIEVAVGDQFAPAEQLTWHEVTTVDLADLGDWIPPRFAGEPVAFAFGEAAVTAVSYPGQLRPGERLAVEAIGPGSGQVQFELAPLAVEADPAADGLRPRGRYRLEGFVPDESAHCGWLHPQTARCVVGEIHVEGVAVPADAINFGDKIALQELQLGSTTLVPGGTLEVTADWLALAPIEDDWTVFVQLLDDQDRIIGQVDQFPLQGVRPTSSWRPGERVRDPYLVPIAAEAAPGSVRLIIGFYRLADLQRLPIVDDSGAPIDDKFTRPGLVIIE